MPVLGIVVTHSGRPDVAARVRQVPGVVEVAEPVPNRLAAVAETARRRDDDALFDALRAILGVLAVDLAFADFSDLSSSDGVSP